jgi:hypothetical protein
MPGRFPLVAVPITGDPFCEGGFCDDSPITIQVTVAPISVAEDDGIPLLFTFELSAPLGFTTTINYTISGSATPYVDYTPTLIPGAITTGSIITGTKTITPGQTTSSIIITPIVDALIEGTESVSIAIDSAICNGVFLEATADSATGGIEDSFNPYIYTYYRLRQPNGAVSGWHNVDQDAPPGMTTVALMGTTTCPTCFPIVLSPTPSTFFPWCADVRSSISGPYAANSTGYAIVYTANFLFLYTSNWNYNVSPGGVNCITAPICGSGKGGDQATWEFTNDNVTSIVLASWEGLPSDYVDLTL